MRVDSELAALARVLSIKLVRQCLIVEGKQAKRLRRLPPELVFWLVVGMGLHRDLSIQSVLERVTCALGEKLGWGAQERPHSTSVAQARDRLGWEVVRTIFRKHAALEAELHGETSIWRGLRLFGLDGTTFRAPDSAANFAWFGGPRTSRGTRAAFPQFRAMVLVGAFSHLVHDVVMGPYKPNELKLAEYMLDRIPPDSLLLVDRAFHSFVWPARFTDRKVFFVMRAKSGTRVARTRLLQKLGRGDELCVLGSKYTRRKWPNLPAEVQVRVITRRINGRKVQVLTNLLSPADYPASEVMELYRDRWEAELGLRELKTYMGEDRVTFRSQRPDRVLQEAYGLFIAFNCVRALMCEAANEARVRPIELSFTGCLTTVRFLLPNLLEQQPEQLHEMLVVALSRERLPQRRRGRSCPRETKPRPFKYAVKRAGEPPGKTRRQKQRAKAEATQKQEAARLRAKRGPPTRSHSRAGGRAAGVAC